MIGQRCATPQRISLPFRRHQWLTKRFVPTTGTSANRDPLTGAPGAHPVGTAAGAVAGGIAAGAAVGTVAGPVGTAIGAAVGAVVGGLAGKGIAEQIDPTAEDAYWRDNYSSRPYVERRQLRRLRPRLFAMA